MSLFMTSYSYAFSEGTIQEIKENLKNLEWSKTELSLETKILNKNDKLKTFFKEDLTLKDLKDIKYIIERYNIERNIIDNALLEKAKKLEDVSREKELLILKKRDLYKELTPYIKSEEIPNYLEYIKGDAQLLKEKKEITEQIIVNNKILVNKVSSLEEKIKQNKEVLNTKIRILVENKVNEKINDLRNNKKYQDLTFELKKKVLDNMIDKIQINILSLENPGITTDTIQKKQEIYQILLDKLQKFKWDIR